MDPDKLCCFPKKIIRSSLKHTNKFCYRIIRSFFTENTNLRQSFYSFRISRIIQSFLKYRRHFQSLSCVPACVHIFHPRGTPYICQNHHNRWLCESFESSVKFSIGYVKTCFQCNFVQSVQSYTCCSVSLTLQVYTTCNLTRNSTYIS